MTWIPWLIKTIEDLDGITAVSLEAPTVLRISRSHHPDAYVATPENGGEGITINFIERVAAEHPEVQFIVLKRTATAHGAFERALEFDMAVGFLPALQRALTSLDDISEADQGNTGYLRSRINSCPSVRQLTWLHEKKKGDVHFQALLKSGRELNIAIGDEYILSYEWILQQVSASALPLHFAINANPYTGQIADETRRRAAEDGISSMLLAEFLAHLRQQ